jgi:hypothetical protein
MGYCPVTGGLAMKPHKHTLDFGDVPDLAYTTAWIRLEDEVVNAMAKFPRTLERARCAVHFCHGISYDPDTEVFLRQGYMRASLAEFVGMEDALKQELPLIGISALPIKANSSRKPLLHIIRELRNFEIHLHSSPLSPQNKSVLWGHYERPHKARPLDIQIWIIDDLTVDQFNKLNNAKDYNKDDVLQLIGWFNAAQKEWGVHDLILRAIGTFCREICAQY